MNSAPEPVLPTANETVDNENDTRLGLPRGSAHNSGSSKSVARMHKIWWGRRRNSYHPDSAAYHNKKEATNNGTEHVNRPPVATIPNPASQSFSAASEGGGGNHNVNNTQRRGVSNFRLFQSRRWRQRYILQMLSSKLWGLATFIFCLILLFANDLQMLFLPRDADPYMTGLYVATLVFFSIDFCLRIDAEPGYFNFRLGCLNWCERKNLPRSHNAPNATSSMVNHHSTFVTTTAPATTVGGQSRFSIGSILFYCDLLSIFALLFDVLCNRPGYCDELHYRIYLDNVGIPIQGLDDVNNTFPIELDPALFLVICRTARVTRYVRSSASVKFTSKVNWYGLCSWCNPFIWWNTIVAFICRICCRRQPNTGGTNEAGNANSPGADGEDADGDGIAMLVNTSAHRRRFGGNNVSTNNVTGSGGNAEDRNLPDREIIRRKSWGNIGMGMVATLRVHQKRQQQQLADHGSWFDVRRFFRFGSLDKEEVRRHLAATRIQRAWRRVAMPRTRSIGNDHNPSNEYDQSERDIAWRGRNNYSSPMDKAMHKRSLVFRYTAVNKKFNRKTSIHSSYNSHLNSSTLFSGSDMAQPLSNTLNSLLRRRNESQVGSAMRELTGQRVAIGILLALAFTVLLTYKEQDATRPITMIILHNQTGNANFAQLSLQAARMSSTPNLYHYRFADGTDQYFDIDHVEYEDLRPREKMRVTIFDNFGRSTEGLFSLRHEKRQNSLVLLVSTIFILLIWFFGVTAFVGPVMTLVVVPIERMIRLLSMLTADPLGYQSSSRYKKFVAEEDEIAKNTRWTKEVLKGMETSFLMSTILRIGSLMKVGFGSAGVEIIRNNLEKGRSKNMLILNSQGSTVCCIFLFCDIRQFTDATECLQEEVFVFTNRIAAVVHSICHSYGGSANKNIGDAFLLSWLLDEETTTNKWEAEVKKRAGESFVAKNNQADRALLSVVRICMALHYDDYYIENMSESARTSLKNKLSKRKGPIVQMGFGLHAGKAVQGAIGSQRKIDATYVSEAVERAEFLESNTKQYGLKMLMSDSFHRLLHPNNRRRCRKIDQILIKNDEDDDDDEELNGDIMELFTFDMDINALWRNKGAKGNRRGKSDIFGHEEESDSDTRGTSTKNSRLPNSKRQVSGVMLKASRKRSVRMGVRSDLSDEFSDGALQSSTVGGVGGGSLTDVKKDGNLTESVDGAPKLVLPTGPALYNANVWVSEDMRKIRQLYSDGLFFQMFNSGLQSFYGKDWESARQCFTTILDRFEDGPSRYYLKKIEKTDGKPPKDFRGYGVA